MFTIALGWRTHVSDMCGLCGEATGTARDLHSRELSRSAALPARGPCPRTPDAVLCGPGARIYRVVGDGLRQAEKRKPRCRYFTIRCIWKSMSASTPSWS